jgi:hypothetical protein
MRYALMICAPPDHADALTDAEREAVVRDYSALTGDPRNVAHAQLQPVDTATSVRVVDGKLLVTDGPFADTKEVLGGFALIEAANLDEVIELAAGIPAARMGGVVEIRPIVEH